MSSCTHEDSAEGDGIAKKPSTCALLLSSRFERRARRPAKARQVTASLDALESMSFGGEEMGLDGEVSGEST